MCARQWFSESCIGPRPDAALRTGLKLGVEPCSFRGNRIAVEDRLELRQGVGSKGTALYLTSRKGASKHGLPMFKFWPQALGLESGLQTLLRSSRGSIVLLISA